ncbi:hypothetical protein DID88_002710 [Monilinia fructigena]|uniref:Uncharacterized protein n=1 Tax=Monilinia fructigena TaxID=38457 RepID=A0A395INC4_9HELO|nr:hypothetical protein DID88_002710 [Monilinia fructigena]
MSKAKAATKVKAKPKSVKEKSKLRAALKRPGDKLRVKKQSPPHKTRAKKPIIIDLTSSSPPPEKRSTTTPKRVTAPSSSERSPDVHSPITRSLSRSLLGPLVVFDASQATQPPEYYIQPIHIRDITPGTVVWLPSKVDIVQNAYVDSNLHVNAFDHPAVIVSMPNPMNIYSVVEIAIMTSLGSRTLQESNKLGHRNLLFRVRTSQLPGAKVDITFKDSRGMKGKYSFVNCHESWRVQIGTLGFYARGRGLGLGRDVDWLRLTTASLEKLRASIGAHKGLWGGYRWL